MKLLSLYLSSGNEDDDRPDCYLRCGDRSFKLPRLLKPGVTHHVAPEHWAWWKRSSRDYTEQHERRFGFSYLVEEGFLQLWLGGLYTYDSKTDRTISFSMPWKRWRHVRLSLYDLVGQEFWQNVESDWKVQQQAQAEVPKRQFALSDFDGEVIEAETYVEEREWRLGEKPFEWLSWFAQPKIRRSLDIAFSSETGRRKGSWKGGTTGHGIEMLPDEDHAAAFQRYCTLHEMTFLGEAQR